MRPYSHWLTPSPSASPTPSISPAPAPTPTPTSAQFPAPSLSPFISPSTGIPLNPSPAPSPVPAPAPCPAPAPSYTQPLKLTSTSRALSTSYLLLTTDLACAAHSTAQHQVSMHSNAEAQHSTSHIALCTRRWHFLVVIGTAVLILACPAVQAARKHKHSLIHGRTLASAPSPTQQLTDLILSCRLSDCRSRSDRADVAAVRLLNRPECTSAAAQHSTALHRRLQQCWGTSVYKSSLGTSQAAHVCPKHTATLNASGSTLVRTHCSCGGRMWSRQHDPTAAIDQGLSPSISCAARALICWPRSASWVVRSAAAALNRGTSLDSTWDSCMLTA